MIQKQLDDYEYYLFGKAIEIYEGTSAREFAKIVGYSRSTVEERLKRYKLISKFSRKIKLNKGAKIVDAKKFKRRMQKLLEKY